MILLDRDGGLAQRNAGSLNRIRCLSLRCKPRGKMAEFRANRTIILPGTAFHNRLFDIFGIPVGAENGGRFSSERWNRFSRFFGLEQGE
jgi:hypothetical protein